MSSARVLGRFHEISVDTDDIRASVEFYESLGFVQASTADTWAHPYGVLTDGRLFLGLHQRRRSTAALTFVVPGLVAQLPALARRQIELTVCRTGETDFHEIGFEDPFGQPVTWLEARTFSPVPGAAASRCGEFCEFSMPSADFAGSKDFWEPLGFIASEPSDDPYEHLPLISDHLNIAFHSPRVMQCPMLVFRDRGLPRRVVQLRESGIRFSERTVRGIDRQRIACLEAPEGTLLLLLEDES